LPPTNQEAVKILDREPLQPEADITETVETDTTAAERLADEAGSIALHIST